jgi:lysine-N-methylase
MSVPVRSLPVVQNWDCQGCGNCCREYQIAVTDEERQRLLDLGWARDPALQGRPPFVQQGGWFSTKYRLNHRPDEACVFLSSENRCLIHERHGPDAKPLACRIYPFVLVPAGDHWRVGLRFACPAASANHGKTLAAHRDELETYARALEAQSQVEVAEIAPPALRPGQSVAWEDLHRFLRALTAILANHAVDLECRLRRCLGLVKICRNAKFDVVRGDRLDEFLGLVSGFLDVEVPSDPRAVEPPTWVGRVLFRQALALYARKDHGPGRGIVQRNRLSLLASAIRFALGRGRVPRVHLWLPETTFDEVERQPRSLSRPAEAVLERYFLVKTDSLQFAGATQFGMGFWEGFESLCLTAPILYWLIRAQRDLSDEEAAVRAIGMVDANFGFNKLLGNIRQRAALRILSARGELTRLIAWYGRGADDPLDTARRADELPPGNR